MIIIAFPRTKTNLSQLPSSFQSSYLVGKYCQGNQNFAKENFQDQSFSVLVTRFPVTNNCATGFYKDVEEFVNEIMVFVPLRRRVPLLCNISEPDASIRGESRLATHTARLSISYAQGVVFKNA